MSVIHPAWALLPWLVALLTIGLIVRLAPQADTPGRFATIDGLRGHLAFAVFMHHGVIWYHYMRSGEWTAPPSGFYNHLGQSSVAVFFMITAFLFTNKLLDARERPIDWLRLYVSRVLRLTPLYLLAMLVLLVMVGELTGWERHVPARELRRALHTWLGFTIGGAPDINGLPQTFTLIAGVTWSLPYEWMFYAALPCLAWLLVRRRPSWWLLALSLIATLGIWSHHKQAIMLQAFAMGGIAAWLVRQPVFRRWCGARAAPWLVIALVTLAVSTSPTAYTTPTMLLLGAAFALVAGGCTLFGALTARLSRRLGDLAYGLYLLHGLLLFACIHFMLGEARVASWSPAQHWALLSALAAPLVALAYLAFRWVEHPAMQQTDRWVGWWRTRRRIA